MRPLPTWIPPVPDRYTLPPPGETTNMTNTAPTNAAALAARIAERAADLAAFLALADELPAELSLNALAVLTAVNRQLARLTAHVAAAGPLEHAEPAATH